MNANSFSFGGTLHVSSLVAALLLMVGVGSRAADAGVLNWEKVSIGGKVELIAELKPVIPTGPDEGSKATASPKIDDSKAEGKLKQCKLQWTAADTNGDGILAGNKVTRYNDMIRTSSQPVISDDARLTETDFMKACMAITVHE
jgi:hypothetical protein